MQDEHAGVEAARGTESAREGSPNRSGAAGRERGIVRCGSRGDVRNNASARGAATRIASMGGARRFAESIWRRWPRGRDRPVRRSSSCSQRREWTRAASRTAAMGGPRGFAESIWRRGPRGEIVRCGVPRHARNDASGRGQHRGLPRGAAREGSPNQSGAEGHEARSSGATFLVIPATTRVDAGAASRTAAMGGPRRFAESIQLGGPRARARPVRHRSTCPREPGRSA